MTDTPTPAEPKNPIEAVDAASLVALFDEDPDTIPEGSLDLMIIEMRRRADVHKAEAALAAAKPKAEKKPRAGQAKLASPEQAAIADKPAKELSLDDLGL